MKIDQRGRSRLVSCVAAGVVLFSTLAHGASSPAGQPPAIEIAQARQTPPRELQPRYEPVPPAEKSWYNDSYIFGTTHAVADSTLQPWAKVTLFTLTVPLDLVLLPFAAIGGLFG